MADEPVTPPPDPDTVLPPPTDPFQPVVGERLPPWRDLAAEAARLIRQANRPGQPQQWRDAADRWLDTYRDRRRRAGMPEP